MNDNKEIIENSCYKADIVIENNKAGGKRKMNIARKIIGVIIMIFGVLLGLFLSVWVLNVGGIIQIAKSLNPIDEIGIAIGAIKLWASWLGYVAGAIVWAVGDLIYGNKK